MTVHVKYQRLDLETKLAIIKEVEAGQLNKTEIAKNYKIPKQTLASIWLQRDKIRHSVETVPSSGKRFSMRPVKNANLEKVLYDFFVVQRKACIPISGPVLAEKALLIAESLGISGFVASTGWLARFKARHSIVFKKICGESKKVDISQVEAWRESNSELINSFSPKDIFNCDETALFFNLLPNRTLAFKGEKTHGKDVSKERLTVMLCSNMTGTEKLRPYVIGIF